MIDVTKVVGRMSDFAATTKDDRLSVTVARVANRLAHQGLVCERKLTRAEVAVIRPFLKAR